MAGDVVPFEIPAGLSAEMADLFGTTNNDLSEGVQESFGVISFKGKVWRVKFKGEERIIKTADGDPAPSLVAVMVKASPQISKIYYEGAYTEGDNDAPKCFSIDGMRPDPGSDATQAPTCAACPKNVWGSKITEQGNKTKACSDSRRIAVVPYPDIKNEAFGGPLLLRVPPASLQELSAYSKLLDDMGLPYQAVITKISFDMELAYPKLKFTALKALSREEAMVVIEQMNSDEVGRMLAEAPIADGVGEAPSEPSLSQQAAATGPAPAAAVVEPTPEPTPEPVPEIVPETVVEPTPEPVVEKQTPKEANAVEAEPVSQELDGLLGTLI